MIAANRDYVALSNQDQTIHSLRYVWAGLLRACDKVEISITDDATGEVIFQTVDEMVRKSYGDGGSIYPANIEIEFDTFDYNLKNNSTYSVKLQGYLDYGDGGLVTNDKNTFEFPLTMDFEAPSINDVQFRYEYDKTLKKNRLYADISVYDNHFAMALQVGYVGNDPQNGPMLYNFTQYMTPVYSQKNDTTIVTYELTDYIYQIKNGAMNKNSFVVSAYDYALNYATYEIGLPDQYVDFYMDGMENNTITLSPNEIYSLAADIYPSTEWAELLVYDTPDTDVVRIVNDKLVAVGPGTATVKVQDPKNEKKRINFNVKVLAEGEEGYVKYDKPVADVFEVVGYEVTNAYFRVASSDRDIGSTGDIRKFANGTTLSMFPSESVLIQYTLAEYFPGTVQVKYSSGNSNIATVDEFGKITAVSEGSVNISVSLVWTDSGKNTNYSTTIRVTVKDPFIANGPYLMSYYGNGGVVNIPEDLHIKYIQSYAFSNYEYVLKTEEEYAIDDSSLSKQSPLGNNTITKVIIPEGVETIYAYAFSKLTALEEVVFPSTLKYIQHNAFAGCSNLKTLSFSGENNIVTINQAAFEGCNITGTLDMPSAYVIAPYAFAGNTNLEIVNLPETAMTVGAHAFAGCASLKEFNISADKVKFGEYAFTGCTSLTSFVLNTSVVPTGLFYGCTKLKDVTIGKDVNAIYEYAFRDTDVDTFEIAEGNTAFQVKNAAYILSADGKTLVAVAPSKYGTLDAASLDGTVVTAVGRGAFSHNGSLNTVILPEVTYVDAYAFAVEKPQYSDGVMVGVAPGRLRTLQLGQLTYIGEYGFCGIGASDLPNIATDAQIGKYAFCYSALAQVNIPDGMTVSEGMFADCASLHTVTIGNNVTIGSNAFSRTKNYIAKIEYYREHNQMYFYYTFSTALKNLTIGDNVVIGENAFVNAASLEKVTLGANAVIGNMAFYNNASLKQIDLSKAVSIGEYAFSGDAYYICADSTMQTPAISPMGMYMYTYHAADLETADLSSCESVGAYAFAYCEFLNTVTLGEKITELPKYIFATCGKLSSINLSCVETIGEYAFLMAGLEQADLTSATNIEKYAFAQNQALNSLKLNPNGCIVGEAAFAECASVQTVENLNCVTEIGAYAFANTSVTDLDLSAAVSIGDFAFIKQELTPVTVKLGEGLTSLGDNPFAMCRLAPFALSEVTTFNGAEYTDYIYTYDLSDTVHVIDGSLYAEAENGGYELIAYAGIEKRDLKVADGTVRIGAYAFAGSDVERVTLPYSAVSIGHKAFYLCEDLEYVVFNSYYAPILEEEFDSTYYETFEHMPGTGDYGTYTDYDGNEVAIIGNGMLPYYMWNATGSMYSNVFYGANFVDYVGYVDEKLTMVRPANGKNYDSFIMSQYFDLVIDGKNAADDVTLAAINAINAIPERVAFEHKDIVDAARAAYTKIATIEQQALVHNYGVLVSAEQRVIALDPANQQPQEETPEKTEKKSEGGLVFVIIVAVFAAVCVAAIALDFKKLFPKKAVRKPEIEETEEPAEQEEE